MQARLTASRKVSYTATRLSCALSTLTVRHELRTCSRNVAALPSALEMRAAAADPNQPARPKQMRLNGKMLNRTPPILGAE